MSNIANPFGTSTPPHGWRWNEVQTGWKMPGPVSQTLSSATKLLLKHRASNPATTQKHNLPMDYDAVQDQLIDYNAKLNGVSVGGPAGPFRSAGRGSGRLVPAVAAVANHVNGAIERIKKLASGAGLLMEWERSGMAPVSREESERRASICALCPKNVTDVPLSEWFTIPAANLIRKEFERLHEANLSTPYDEKLNVCEACECPLRLKVHAPMSLILKRIKPEQKTALAPGCWIREQNEDTPVLHRRE